MADVLVLDANYRPVGFKPLTEAIKNVYEDRAIVIKEDESGKKLHGGMDANGKVFEMGMPRVIRVRNAWTKRKRQSVPFSRRNIYTRDEGECQYCGRELGLNEYTLEHVLPRCQGGISSWVNIVVACIRCNKRKSGMTPEQAGMKLLNKPVEPKVDDPKYNFKLHVTVMRPEWRDYAAWIYWNSELEP